MGIIWFIVAVVFFVLWLRKDGGSSHQNDYAQGYWDGYRAFGEKVRRLLANKGDVKPHLKSLIDEGHGIVAQDVVDEPVVRTAEIDDKIAMQQPASIAQVSQYVESQPTIQYLQQPRLTPEMLVANKEQAALRNMNTILYFASFLLVAAAAAFIAASMPPAVRLAGLLVVVALFYSAGLVLYKKVVRLRPAAVAFVGTGLAILPFVGVALHILGGFSGTVSWLVVSLVGLVAYYVAAIILQSQVVSYLTMAFLLSLVSASVGVATLPIIWYFILLIGVSLIASSISVVAPKAVPAIFREPVERTGQVVTPFVLLASLLVPIELTTTGYEILFAIATAHYLVTWLQRRSMIYETATRLLAQVTLMVTAWDLANNDRASFGLLLMIILTIQAAYSLARVRVAQASSRATEQAWLTCLFIGMQLIQPVWFFTEHAAWWSSVALTMTGLLALGTAIRFTNARWGYVGLAASVPLVLTITCLVIKPAFSAGLVSTIFAVFAASAIVASYSAKSRWHGGRIEELSLVASTLYLIVMAFAGLASTDAVTIGFSSLGFVIGLVALSYNTSEKAVEAIAVIPLLIAVAAFLSKTSVYHGPWYGTSVVCITTSLLAATTLMYHMAEDRGRRNVLAGLTLAVFGCLLFVSANLDETVRQAHIVLLAAASVTLLGVRVGLREKSSVLRVMTTSAYLSYIIAAWLVCVTIGGPWATLVYVAMVIVFWMTSFIQRQIWMMVIGNISVLAAVDSLWDTLHLSGDWRLFGIVWIGVAVLYATYWLFIDRKDEGRQKIQIGTVWTTLGFLLVLTIFSSDMAHETAWSLTVLFLAATLCAYGYMRKQKTIMEIAIYIATFGLQRLIAIAIPETNLVFYAHWWALVVMLAAWWRGTTREQATRWVIAVTFVTLGTGIFALSSGGWYQLLFLIEQLVFLVVGAFCSIRWLLWWGLSAASLAVLYFLHGYTYLWLGFLGLLLIAIVVWQLLRLNNKPHSKQ